MQTLTVTANHPQALTMGELVDLLTARGFDIEAGVFLDLLLTDLTERRVRGGTVPAAGDMMFLMRSLRCGADDAAVLLGGTP